MTPEALFAAVKLISRCLDDASLETLQEVHTHLQDHFLRVTDVNRGNLDNAAEQRVLGMLWAEIEVAIDERTGGS